MADLIGRAPYEAALVDVAGALSRAWLPWVQAVTSAGRAVASAQASVSDLQAALTADRIDIVNIQSRLQAADVASTAAAAALAALQVAGDALQASVRFQGLTIGAQQAQIDALGALSLIAASAMTDGFLKAVDWVTFNAKQDALTFPLAVADGGTGAATELLARISLGVAGLADVNVFTALNYYNAGAIYKTPPATAQLILDSTTAGQQVVIQYFDNGVSKWLFGKAADQSFFLYDNVHGVFLLSTDPSTGNLTISVPTTITGALVVAAAGQNSTTNGKTITFYDCSSGAATLAAADNTSTLDALEITKSGAVVSCNFPNGPVTLSVAPVFTDQAGSRTALGLGAAALLAVPIPIASGGTGASTFLAAGLPVLAGGNTWTGTQTFGFILSTGVGQPTNSATGIGIGYNVAGFITMGPSAGLKWGSSNQTGTFDVGLYRNGAGVLQVNNGTPGTLAGLRLASLSFPATSNAKVGTGTLVAGTVTVSNTSVTANSKIFLTPTSSSATTSGVLAVTALSAGVSFTVKSSLATDVATFNYFILETA